MDEIVMSSEAPGNRMCEVAAAKIFRAELAEASRRVLVIVDPNGCLKAKRFHWKVPDEVAYLGLREFNGNGSMAKHLAARWLIC
jgi:hypothetical protein